MIWADRIGAAFGWAAAHAVEIIAALAAWAMVAAWLAFREKRED